MKLPKILAAGIAALTLAGGAVYAETVVRTTTSSGVLADYSPEYMTIRSETSTEPLQYRISPSTVYVDEVGAPVSVQEIRTQRLPVTVHYVTEGDRRIANRVVVRRQRVVSPAPVIEERRTVAPVIEERRTVAPTVIEERRTVAPVAPAVVEQRTTTTTTTTRADEEDDD